MTEEELKVLYAGVEDRVRVIDREFAMVMTMIVIFGLALLLWGCAPMSDRLTVPQDERPAKCKECR